MVASTSELRLGRMPWSSASWIGGRPWPIAISMGAAMEMRAPVSLSRRHAVVAQMGAVDVFVAGPQQPGAPELEQGAFGVVAHAVGDATHADLARIGEDAWRRARAPSASVSNWSCELKYVLCSRTMSCG